MTAAYNEEALIEKTIRSVLAQTILPQRWVIVSDGSSDGTDAIVEKYARQHAFIRFLRLTRGAGRSFGSKVRALRRGAELLDGIAFDFIGNIDADISVERSYFEDLVMHLERHPRLGIVAGFVYEENNGEFRPRSSNRVDSVPHGAQLLRRECYEDVGGYAVFEYGGEDWYAQTCAKMNGWDAQALPGLRIFHYRHTGAGANLLRDRFRLGRLDYSFGSDPVFEIFKCIIRLPEPPFLVGAIARFTGFFWSSICRDRRPVSSDFSAFLRREQKAKLGSWSRFFERQGAARARVQ